MRLLLGPPCHGSMAGMEPQNGQRFGLMPLLFISPPSLLPITFQQQLLSTSLYVPGRSLWNSAASECERRLPAYTVSQSVEIRTERKSHMGSPWPHDHTSAALFGLTRSTFDGASTVLTRQLPWIYQHLDILEPFVHRVTHGHESRREPECFIPLDSDGENP